MENKTSQVEEKIKFLEEFFPVSFAGAVVRLELNLRDQYPGWE